jgi:hypothetical protein
MLLEADTHLGGARAGLSAAARAIRGNRDAARVPQPRPERLVRLGACATGWPAYLLKRWKLAIASALSQLCRNRRLAR